MKVSFSIIVPVYDAEATLAESLNSISNQTHQDFELIVINDGSTDGSMEVYHTWRKSNPHLDTTLIEQENQGLGNTRNKGIGLAKHPWVALLDADDIWLANKLEHCSRSILKQEADIYYHPVVSFGIGNPRVRPCLAFNNMEDLLTKGNPIIPSAVVLRAEILKDFNFSENPDFHGAEDLLLWLELIHKGLSFKKIDIALTKYREVGGMSTKLDEHLQKVTNVLSYAMELGWIDINIMKASVERKHLEAARFHHKRGNFKQANKHYKQAGAQSFKYNLLYLLSLIGFTR